VSYERDAFELGTRVTKPMNTDGGFLRSSCRNDHVL
jgi:hypothetical protein